MEEVDSKLMTDFEELKMSVEKVTTDVIKIAGELQLEVYTNVHCSTVYNSKDLESTQMPIDNRLDWKNVAHIHHGILCSNQK